MTLRTVARDLGVAARIARGVMARRFRGAGSDPEPNLDAWRGALAPWLERAQREGAIVAAKFVSLPAKRPPWTSSGLDVEAGQRVSWFAAGRVHLSRALDIWVGPSFQLWARVGQEGPVFRGTRDTHTFTAERAGALEFASYFPGEWDDPRGTLGHGAADYRKVSGGMAVLVVTWSSGIQIDRWLQEAASAADAPQPVRDEARRIATAVPTPDDWHYLWYLGPGEIYRRCTTPEGHAAICCDTHGDVGILRRDAAMPLEPGTRIEWRWRVDELPARMREDSLPSHDYVSLAVEFDDGQDLTYYWSAELPVGTVYRCPLPTWAGKETHVVIRSGSAGLAQWHDESRDLQADYHHIIGGPARSVVRVWLIANSLFQRGRGRCEYSAIRLRGPRANLDVL